MGYLMTGTPMFGLMIGATTFGDCSGFDGARLGVRWVYRYLFTFSPKVFQFCSCCSIFASNVILPPAVGSLSSVAPCCVW